MERASAFAPEVDAAARVLILGTLPGRESLARGEYYAHPRNAFWRLVGEVIGREDLATLPYAERLAVTRAAGLGLDDVVASATRRGSLDGAIRDAHHKDIRALVARLPALRAVAFNGGTAARIGRRLLGTAPGPALIDLPSSSPAHARMRYPDKLEAWRRLGEYLG